MQFGGEETLTKSMCLPPIGTPAVGVARRDVELRRGAWRPSPSRSRGPCGRWCPRRCSRPRGGCAFASSFRNSMPISSRTRIAVSWIAATPSSVSGSVGRSVLIGSRHGSGRWRARAPRRDCRRGRRRGAACGRSSSALPVSSGDPSPGASGRARPFATPLRRNTKGSLKDPRLGPRPYLLLMHPGFRTMP